MARTPPSQEAMTSVISRYELVGFVESYARSQSTGLPIPVSELAARMEQLRPRLQIARHESDAIVFAGFLKDCANWYFRKARYEESERIYDHASRFDPLDLSHLSNRAACWFKLDDLNKCISICDEVRVASSTIPSAGTDKSVLILSRVLCRKGKCSLLTHDLPTAVECLQDVERMLEAHPNVARETKIQLDLAQFKNAYASYSGKRTPAIPNSVPESTKLRYAVPHNDSADDDMPGLVSDESDSSQSGPKAKKTKSNSNLGPSVASTSAATRPERNRSGVTTRFRRPGSCPSDDDSLPGLVREDTMTDLSASESDNDKSVCSSLPELTTEDDADEDIDLTTGGPQTGAVMNSSAWTIDEDEDVPGLVSDSSHNSIEARGMENSSLHLPPFSRANASPETKPSDKKDKRSGGKSVYAGDPSSSDDSLPELQSEDDDTSGSEGSADDDMPSLADDENSPEEFGGENDEASDGEEFICNHGCCTGGVPNTRLTGAHGRASSSGLSGFTSGFLDVRTSNRSSSNRASARIARSGRLSGGSSVPSRAGPSSREPTVDDIEKEADYESDGGEQANLWSSSVEVEHSVVSMRRLAARDPMSNDVHSMLTDLTQDLFGKTFSKHQTVDFIKFFGPHVTYAKTGKRKNQRKKGCDPKCPTCYARRSWKERFLTVDSSEGASSSSSTTSSSDLWKLVPQSTWKRLGSFGSGSELKSSNVLSAIVHGSAYISRMQSEFAWKGERIKKTNDIQYLLQQNIFKLSRSAHGLKSAFEIYNFLKQLVDMLDGLSGSPYARGLSPVPMANRADHVARRIYNSSSGQNYPVSILPTSEAAIPVDIAGTMYAWAEADIAPTEEELIYRTLLHDVQGTLKDLTMRTPHFLTGAWARSFEDKPTDDKNESFYRILHSSTIMRARTLEKFADVASKDKKVPRAAALLSEAIKRRPNSARLLYRRAKCAFYRNRLKDCRIDIQKAKKLLTSDTCDRYGRARLRTTLSSDLHLFVDITMLEGDMLIARGDQQPERRATFLQDALDAFNVALSYAPVLPESCRLLASRIATTTTALMEATETSPHENDHVTPQPADLKPASAILSKKTKEQNASSSAHRTDSASGAVLPGISCFYSECAETSREIRESDQWAEVDCLRGCVLVYHKSCWRAHRRNSTNGICAKEECGAPVGTPLFMTVSTAEGKRSKRPKRSPADYPKREEATTALREPSSSERPSAPRASSASAASAAYPSAVAPASVPTPASASASASTAIPVFSTAVDRSGKAPKTSSDLGARVLSCALCSKEFNSRSQYDTHVIGKKHLAMVERAGRESQGPSTRPNESHRRFIAPNRFYSPSGGASGSSALQGNVTIRSAQPNRHEIMQLLQSAVVCLGGEARMRDVVRNVNLRRWNIDCAETHLNKTYGGLRRLLEQDQEHIFEIDSSRGSSNPFLVLRSSTPAASASAMATNATGQSQAPSPHPNQSNSASFPARSPSAHASTPTAHQLGVLSDQYVVPRVEDNAADGAFDLSQMVADILEDDFNSLLGPTGEPKASSAANETNDGDDNLCGICLDNALDCQIIPCRHAWCRACLKENMKKGRMMCPLCNTPVETVAVYPG